MVRAVADPWPGALSYVGNQNSPSGRRVFILMPPKAQPGRDSVAPLLIACGDGAPGNRHWTGGRQHYYAGLAISAVRWAWCRVRA